MLAYLWLRSAANSAVCFLFLPYLWWRASFARGCLRKEVDCCFQYPWLLIIIDQYDIRDNITVFIISFDTSHCSSSSASWLGSCKSRLQELLSLDYRIVPACRKAQRSSSTAVALDLIRLSCFWLVRFLRVSWTPVPCLNSLSSPFPWQVIP